MKPLTPHFPLVVFFTKCYSTTEPKEPSFWRKLRERDCQVRTELPTETWPLMSSQLKTKRGHGFFRGFQMLPPDLSGQMCSVEGAWINKTKTQWIRLSKTHLLPASYCQRSGAVSPREPQAPYVPSWPAAARPFHLTFTEPLLVQNKQSM